jgi:hypothetical protein
MEAVAMRHARTKPLTIGRNDRAHVMLGFTPDEARELEAAASGLPVATWCRWAALRMARLVNTVPPSEP